MARAAAEPLIDHTEPINSRVQRKAKRLARTKFDRYVDLRRRNFDLGNALSLLWWSDGLLDAHRLPTLPLRESSQALDVPEPVLSATTLRELLMVTCAAYNDAVAAFDEVFGERA